jgi:glycosyltransferase involved in cell wall biosynthesis
MTPLEGNGQNGGAGLVAASLVHHLSALAPEFRFTLLTAESSHAELASLDGPNVQRHCVRSRSTSPTRARQLVDRLLPPQTRVRLKRAYWSLRTSQKYSQLTEDLRPDLLFSPFTVPYFWRPGIPSISIVYDLQQVTYPEFFSPEQRLNRQRHIQDACTRSEGVVCISDYVRGTLLAGFDVRPERVTTIPLGLLRETARADPEVIDRLGLKDAEFLLYPANFWPHKNHLGLFEAISVYLAAHPDSRLRLVCTGAPNTLLHSLQAAARTRLPSDTVVFPGYLAEQELAALLDACAALIFPSLYEGFGMPILEAMAAEKPVLCSKVTSLPEVAGDAAIYFDPTDPRQIAESIEALANRARIADLVSRGRARAQSFGDGQRMATEYLSLFRAVLTSKPAAA